MSVIGDHLLASVPETDVCLDGGHALAEGLVLGTDVGVFGFQRVDAVACSQTVAGETDAENNGSSLLTDDARPSSMSLTAEDFERYLRSDDDGEPLGDALAALALEVETDAVADVRAIREHE